ncbi:hypothetical protein GCM10027169_24290 [Gordonia jinhuaensis]
MHRQPRAQGVNDRARVEFVPRRRRHIGHQPFTVIVTVHRGDGRAYADHLGDRRLDLTEFHSLAADLHLGIGTSQVFQAQLGTLALGTLTR